MPNNLNVDLLIFFCGRHVNDNDVYAGARGMIESYSASSPLIRGYQLIGSRGQSFPRQGGRHQAAFRPGVRECIYD